MKISISVDEYEVKAIAYEYEKAQTPIAKKERMLELLDELQIPYKSANDYIHIQVRAYEKVSIDIWPTTNKICFTVKIGVKDFKYYYIGAKTIANELIHFKKRYNVK